MNRKLIDKALEAIRLHMLKWASEMTEDEAREEAERWTITVATAESA